MTIRIPRKARPAAVPAPINPRRKAGQRAGLTSEKIMSTARSVLKAGKKLTIATIADELEVQSNSIHSRYPTGIGAIERELTRWFLNELVRPPAPNEAWDAKLRQIFDDAFSLGRTNPALGRLIAGHLGEDPLLEPYFAEQVLYVASWAGIGPKEYSVALALATAALAGALLVTCPLGGRSHDEHPTTRIDLPSARQFPQIHAGHASFVTDAKAEPGPADVETHSDIGVAGSLIVESLIGQFELLATSLELDTP